LIVAVVPLLLTTAVVAVIVILVVGLVSLLVGMSLLLLVVMALVLLRVWLLVSSRGCCGSAQLLEEELAAVGPWVGIVGHDEVTGVVDDGQRHGYE